MIFLVILSSMRFIFQGVRQCKVNLYPVPGIPWESYSTFEAMGHGELESDFSGFQWDRGMPTGTQHDEECM